jgi:zinc protease
VVYPSEEDLAARFHQAEALPVEPYEEEISSEPLIPVLPAPGRITATTEDPLFGATVYTLSNGVKVILKPTEYKKDQILMKASSPGGGTLLGDADAYNLKLFNNVADVGGLGNFSATQLSKALTGKNVSCTLHLDDDAESISGSAVPSDIRALFELIYLTFTAPRHDEEAYGSLKERFIAQLENMKLNPMVAFNDTITKALYNSHLWAKRIETEDVRRVSYDRILEIYKERLADASDFTFTFVGNVVKDSMIPMMEQYLATLPSLQRSEQGDADRIPALRKGVYTNHFHRTMETPKTSVFNYYSGQMDYTPETILTASMLKQILDLVYTEKVRENESGSYHVGTNIRIASFPKGQATLQTYFDTDPAMEEKLTAIVKDELQSIVKNGPREADYIKTRDNMLKRHEESLQENGYWLNALDEYYFHGYNRHTDYVDTLQNITPAQIQAFAKALTAQGNYIEIVMEP